MAVHPLSIDKDVGDRVETIHDLIIFYQNVQCHWPGPCHGEMLVSNIRMLPGGGVGVLGGKRHYAGHRFDQTSLVASLVCLHDARHRILPMLLPFELRSYHAEMLHDIVDKDTRTILKRIGPLYDHWDPLPLRQECLLLWRRRGCKTAIDYSPDSKHPGRPV